jgi:hypothetical protein
MGETPRTDHAMGDGDAAQEGDAGMVKTSSPRHALVGYSGGEFAAYWQWLNAITGGYVDPENKVRAVAAAEANMRGHGKHVAKEDA